MNVQFNLLPDVKVEFLKARKSKRLVIVVCFVVTAVLVVFSSLAYLDLFQQKRAVNNASKDITKRILNIEQTTDLKKILTVQNQLNSLTALYETRPASHRTYSYLSLITPSEVTFSRININYEANTVQFEGRAQSIKSVNSFTDILKATRYSTKDANEETSLPAFKDVVLRGFGLSNEGTTFDISIVFDPIIFEDKQTVTLLPPDNVGARMTSAELGNTNNEFLKR